MLLSLAVGYLAYSDSRKAILRAVANENLAASVSLAKQVAVELEGAESRPDFRQFALERIESVWEHAVLSHPNSYLSVIESPGVLTLHTRSPDRVGSDVGSTLLQSEGRPPKTVAELLKTGQPWSGESLCPSGKRLLVGYAYMAPLDALIAVHVPADVVEAHIQRMAAPWTYGMLLVIGFLLPLAFGLLHYSYHSAERATQGALSALRESEERFRTLVEMLPNGVQRNDLSGRITFSNPAHCRMHGYEPGELIGRYIWDFKPTAEERAALIEQFQYLVREQPEPKPVRTRDLTRDGRIISVQVDWTYERDPSGRLTGFVSVISDITQQVEAEASLREFARRLQTLSRKLLAAQETERRRIATDLHDQIGQSLTALKMNLQSLRRSVGNGDEAQAWGACLKTLDDTIQEVRNLSRALRPSVLDDLGLVPAIQWLLKSQIKQAGLKTRLQTNLDDVRLPPPIETAAFRIVQEAINNCLRHARARRLDVSVCSTGETLLLRIEDDGAGFEVQQALQRANRGDSLGLLGMQERAVLLDGDLQIESAPGQGTRICATIPIRAAPEEQ